MNNAEITKAKNLIKQGDLKSAIDLLLQLTEGALDNNNIVIAQSARLKDISRKESMGVVSFENATQTRNQIAFALIEMLSTLEAEIVATQKRVFISYNHKDATTANKLKEKLVAAGINVTIDSESMGAGENIQSFIEKSVRDTESTLSIVSVNSLLSAWVAMETLNTFGLQLGKDTKKFIPCFIEPDFFDSGFTDTAIIKLNEKIADLASIIENRLKQGQDSLDINDEYSRLIKLRNSIGEIIGRLRASLCIDISAVNFEAGLPKIIQKIKE